MLERKLMSRSFCGVSALVILLALSTAANTARAQADALQFQSVKAKTFDKEKFQFPDDLKGDPVNILFLAMSNEREGGEKQQQVLLAWNAALEEAGAFSNSALPYHFIVMESPPFFVKGMITGAMRDVYEEGNVPLDQSAVFFVDDLGAFAAGAGVPLDEQPTLVLTSADGKPLAQFKGEVSDAGVAEVMSAIRQYTGDADVN
jgi:hypothetical protein